MFYSERPSSNICSIWSIYHYNKCLASWNEKRTIIRPLTYHLRRSIIFSDHSLNDNLPPRTTRYIAHSDITTVIGNPIITQPNIDAQNITDDISLLLLPIVPINSRAEKLELIECSALVRAVTVVAGGFNGLVNTCVSTNYKSREKRRYSRESYH